MEFFARPFAARALRRQIEDSRPALYRLAFAWCHDPALADDLAQETLARGLTRIAQLRDAGRLKSWLFAILANCWRDHLRALRPTDDIDDVDESVLVDDCDPADLHQRRDLARRVRAAVAELPVGQRAVLTLVDLEECSYAEVAEILAIPIGTVMSRLCRARRALAGRLANAPAVPLRSVK